MDGKTCGTFLYCKFFLDTSSKMVYNIVKTIGGVFMSPNSINIQKIKDQPARDFAYALFAFESAIRNNKDAMYSAADAPLSDFCEYIYKGFIRDLADKGYTKEDVRDHLGLDDATIDRLSEEIAEEALYKLVDERVRKHCGEDGVWTGVTPQKEVWAELGITAEDLADIEINDDDYE
jgi:hypothetical protein